MEYILAHKGGRGQSFVYELLYQGEGNQGDNFMLGLKNMEKHQYDKKKTGLNNKLSGSKRPQNGVKTGGSRGNKNSSKATNTNTSDDFIRKISDNALQGAKKTVSHPVVPA